VKSKTGALALTLGALGVVFGDLGTSPLYALQTVFTADHHAVHTTPGEVYGVISLVFWTVTLIVSVKYVGFVMRADNGGEGGILALTALLQGATFRSARAKIVLVMLGIVGASLFIGDGMITPAISVLSAVEGLKVSTPGLSDFVVPISVALLTGLFTIQHFGTGFVGALFGPVMLVWFTVIGLIGLGEVAQHPDILQGLSPTYAVEFMLDHGAVAFVALGSVVLAVTGAEALYADMGHFGRAPIRRAWFLFVFPALTLNYLAQGALILRSPASISNPFYLLVPNWAQMPMVVLATMATVIASQAVISGVFSVVRQAMQLGFFPRITIRHTSERQEGRIYAPAINWGLFVAVIALVLGFGSSAALASAYGVAVAGTFVLTTILFLAVARVLWRKPRWLIALGAVVFLSVELAFFSASLTKVVHGGWAPLAIAAVTFTLMATWRRGREIVTENRNRKEGPLREFIRDLHAGHPPVQRVPGTAVFLNLNPETTPLALRANVEHLHVMHQNVIMLSVRVVGDAYVAESARLAVDALGDPSDGITRVAARFGYHDRIDVPATIRLVVDQGLLERDVDPEQISYFISTITPVRTRAPGIARWRKALYTAVSRTTPSPVEYFHLPVDRTINIGEQIEI
jgi:KUP system potassium uptake protein